MQADFWLNRWREMRIGFHQSQANPMLAEHWKQLCLANKTPVLVPLCGKSQDMIWISQQSHPVIGIELSRKAIEQFDQENSRRGSWLEIDGFDVYQSEMIRIWNAGFFELSHKQLGPVNAIFDRAALIAMPVTLRQQYCEQINKLAAPLCKQLLISLEYEQTKRSGPPFSVRAQEIASLYSGWDIECLSQSDIPQKQPPAIDAAYLLTHKR